MPLVSHPKSFASCLGEGHEWLQFLKKFNSTIKKREKQINKEDKASLEIGIM